MSTDSVGYSPEDWALVERAAQLAWDKHQGDYRKGGAGIPYISHVWAVASLVMEHGGSPAQVAAALLHDTAEDAGGEKVLDEIREVCGAEVAELVRGLSDSLVEDPTQKAPWRQRKEDYLAHLDEASADVRLVSAADKLANARSMAKDFAEQGSALWERFNTKSAEDQFWYYESLITKFEETGTAPGMVAELSSVIADLRYESGEELAAIQPSATIDELMAIGLPLNRKERFYTGTVLPALMCADGMAAMQRFLDLVDLPNPDLDEGAEGSIQFFTEYSVVESAVGHHKERFASKPGPKDTPDLVILMTKPEPVLLAIEAKMFDRPSRNDMLMQLDRQRIQLEDLVKALRREKTLSTLTSKHVALLPRRLGEAYGELEVGGESMTVVTWESVRDAYRASEQTYFWAMLDYALRKYDDLVSKFGVEHGTRTGARLVRAFLAGETEWSHMGVQSGLHGTRLTDLIGSGYVEPPLVFGPPGRRPGRCEPQLVLRRRLRRAPARARGRSGTLRSGVGVVGRAGSPGRIGATNRSKEDLQRAAFVLLDQLYAERLACALQVGASVLGGNSARVIDDLDPADLVLMHARPHDPQL